MHIPGLWPSFIPPALKLSAADRATVRQVAVNLRGVAFESDRRFRRKQGGLALTASAVLTAGVVLIDFFESPWYATPLLMIAGLATYLVIRRRATAPFVRRALTSVGHEVCVACCYLLRELPDEIERCPECGAERDHLQRDEARAEWNKRNFERGTRRTGRPPRWERAR